jgi:hypothetical protein
MFTTLADAGQTVNTPERSLQVRRLASWRS